MWTGNDCHDNGRLSSFHIDGNISDKPLALHTGTHKPFTVQLHPGRCYTKIRGNGFRLLTQTKDIPCIIGGNREPRRATTDVHSLPILLFYFFYIKMSTCSLFSLSFFFSLLFTSFSFPFSVYRPLRRLHFFIHAFWSREIEDNYQRKESWT